MSEIIAILISTVVLGSIYGLVAIGMTLIYGTLRILDMSQGSMVMMGGFVAWGSWSLPTPTRCSPPRRVRGDLRHGDVHPADLGSAAHEPS